MRRARVESVSPLTEKHYYVALPSGRGTGTPQRRVSHVCDTEAGRTLCGRDSSLWTILFSRDPEEATCAICRKALTRQVSSDDQGL
jgi:hypothetical protein